MQAFLAIVAAIMSIICWLKNKESSSLLPVGDASTSAAIEKIDVQHRKKRGTYNHNDGEIRAKIIFAKMSIILETLNISRFTL